MAKAGKMDYAPIHLVVDDREKAGGKVPAALAARGDVTVEIARLDVGDYRVERRVVVERKTAADFAASLIDGRLFHQAAALALAPERAVLVLEGCDKDWHDTGVRREALQGALITIGVFFGVTVLRSDGPEETARLLVYLGRQAQRSAHGGLPRPGYRPKGKRARQLFLLQGLPGVGPERAARLLERFGSVQAIMTASADDLATVDGIGEKTAAKMRWSVQEPALEYKTASAASAAPVEMYTPERVAEFLLGSAVDERSYAEAVAAVRKMGLDPKQIDGALFGKTVGPVAILPPGGTT
jgi:ERCC4-type nuclease